ncbi:hypothetical protein [Hafnia alvei]|uniref:hypothetical protein n=1 Tax=Hafnia alvei TaxID=569 RepID=UPI000FDB0221|nr:hypothetical protein [Hafnia alvei]
MLDKACSRAASIRNMTGKTMKLTVIGVPVVEDTPDIEIKLRALAHEQNVELMQSDTKWYIGNQIFYKTCVVS